MEYEALHRYGDDRPWILERSTGAPWFGYGALLGPSLFEELAAADGTADPPPGSAVSQLILDGTLRRAVLFTVGIPDDTAAAVESVATGVWRAFGWRLRFRDDPWPGEGDPFERTRRRTAVSYERARQTWAWLCNAATLLPGLPTEADVAPLADHLTRGGCVRFMDGMPVLQQGEGSWGKPRERVFAVGCAVASGRLTHDGLAPADAWRAPPVVDEVRVADALQALRDRLAPGVRADELEVNLAEAIALEREALHAHRDTPLEDLPDSVRANLWRRVASLLVEASVIV